jgi:2-keto-4-pentenoate hydratase/2-oxohepta-3-ene-1,7-dioic acid hydratase in catechol pathway
MKIARYDIDGKIGYGRLDDNGTIHVFKGLPTETSELTGQTLRIGDVRLLAPVELPRIIGVGLNYVSHIKESKAKEPSFPMLFMKHGSAVIGPDQPIIYPRQGKNVHFEGELAAVIGRPARRVPEKEALDYVFGYTCANDVSERIIQHAEMDTGCLLIGKSFDTFCPLGPVIATEIDPTDLDLLARVNGKIRQQINTSDLLFSVAKLVSYISDAFTLLPGDVIITGTPAGVGAVKAGDVIEIEISGIGILKNTVEAEE